MNIKERQFTEPVYTIGVAAEKVGISVHSFRQYEREGLIIPHKTATGRRLYSDLEIEKMRCIKLMIREEGLNFEGIRRLMALVPCWKLRECKEKERKTCPAFTNIKRPCWATEEKCHHPYPTCRDCEVYRSIVHCSDLRDLLFVCR
ncbi:MAG: MerR family transcriptional regulator [bacterium]|nr:MerR family transcriptional regulator [bacterium]